ncbi:MAG: fatty acid desaturase [Crocosphaera sp.]
MLVKKRIDYYPITIIFLVLAIDLFVFLFSPSVWLTMIWMIFGLSIKGWICCWNHHHQHYNFFTVAWANRLIELVMGLQTGIIGEGWVLHHTLGHHLNYLDQSKDESAWKTPQGRLMSRLEYAFKVSITAYPRAWKVGEQYPKSRKKLIENILLTAFVLGLLCSINWINTLILFVVPMIILLFMSVNETYDHHAGLDTEDPYQATYNITDRWYNILSCNLGYHTAHHLQCGKHWSELPQLHENIKHKIPANLYREPGFPCGLLTKIEQRVSQRFSTN